MYSSVVNLAVFPRIWGCFLWSCVFLRLAFCLFWGCFVWNLLFFWVLFFTDLCFADCFFSNLWHFWSSNLLPKQCGRVFLKICSVWAYFFWCASLLFYLIFLLIVSVVDFSCQTHVGLVFRLNYLFWAFFKILACFCKATWHHWCTLHSNYWTQTFWQVMPRDSDCW